MSDLLVQHGDRIDPDKLAHAVSIAFVRSTDPHHPDKAGDNNNDDSDIAQLVHAARLKFLSIAGSKVTNSGFGALSELTDLEAINASETSIGDQGIRHLRHSDKLHVLQLEGTRITNAGVENLVQRFPDLTHLSLSNTMIDDGAMQSLGKLNRLTHLELSCTKVSDASIPALSNMTQLQSLDITRQSDDDNTISKEGADELRHALPNTEIFHW